MQRRTQFIGERSLNYATVADFFQIYNEEMDSLYLLSVLLTADIEKAEQCFVDGMQECLHGMDVFIEWACSSARRTIIKHAIQIILPVPERADSHSSVSLEWHPAPGMNNVIGAILALGAFERFVFVMSLLERQSDEDCSAFLGCRRQDVKSARARALKCLSHIDSGCDPSEEALQVWRTIQAQRNIPTSV
jgi:hypothetical protein